MRAAVIASLIIFGISPVLSQGGGNVGVSDHNTTTSALAEAGREALRRGKDTEDVKTMLLAVADLRAAVKGDPTSVANNYELALAEYDLGVQFQQSDKQSAELWLDRAIADTKKTIRLDGASSDAHTLLSDLYGTKIGLDGFWTAIRLGPKADSELETALRLNPDNPRAHLTKGRRYLYSPRMFGGDLDKAISSFKEATLLDPHSDDAFRWLAIALIKKGDTVLAKQAIAEAMHLNPQSRADKELAKTIH